MNRNTAFLFIAFLISLQTGFAQISPTDVKLFKSANWKSTKLKSGVVWKQANITGLFNSNQEINYVEIDLKKHRKNIALAALSNKLEKTSTLAKENNGIVAINGGFFNMKAGGAVDYLKVNNKIYYEQITTVERGQGFFAFDNKRTIITMDSNAITTYENVIQSGPFLLQNGEIQTLSKNAFNDNRHPRTSIGLKGNKLILLVVDGRNPKAQGVSLQELSQIFKLLGCDQAMNLDGGGSSTLFINTPKVKGVVNYPTDNKLFDHEGERSVANIIYIKENN